MTGTKPKLLITGLCPDRLNTNIRLREAIREGAVESDFFDEVAAASIEVVLAYGQLNFDFVLAVGGAASDTVDFEALRGRCRGAGAVLLFWTHEDPYEFDLNRRILSIPDFYFTNERAALPYYDNEKVFWLPLAGDIQYQRNIKPLEERKMDLFFCGYDYPVRVHILERFLHSFGKDFVFGLYGPNMRRRFPGVGDDRFLSTSEMAETARHAILTLNIGRDLAIANSQFSIVAETPGPRTFDIALAGSPQIMFDTGIAIDDFYIRGKEMLTFDEPADIFNTVSDLKADPSKFLAIAKAAQQRTLDQHLYRHRIKTMMQAVREG